MNVLNLSTTSCAVSNHLLHTATNSILLGYVLKTIARVVPVFKNLFGIQGTLEDRGRFSVLDGDRGQFCVFTDGTNTIRFVYDSKNSP